jgi:hypothetical protein
MPQHPAQQLPRMSTFVNDDTNAAFEAATTDATTTDADRSGEGKPFAGHVDAYGATNNMSYNVENLITLNVFGKIEGSIFTNKDLWWETGMMAILFWAMFGVMFYFRWEGFEHFVGKEENNRAFLSMFSTLIGLLLSFYTALNLSRWWSLRVCVMNVTEGCRRLTMLLAHGVTCDKAVLSNVQRYSRASLFVLFASQRWRPGNKPVLDQACQAGFLTAEEARLLDELSPGASFIQAETLWVWLANVITRLNAQKLTAGPPHYCALLAAVEHGREGIGDIQTYLETPIPMGYVHLLCCLVKLHNFILTLLMSFACVMMAGHKDGADEMGTFRCMFRAFFMPFLYNAILALNGAVSNPFNDDFQDFDARYLDVLIKKSAGAISNAAFHKPTWLSTDRKFPPCEAAMGDHLTSA